MKKPDILKEIIAKKKERLALSKQGLSLDELKARIAGLSPLKPFKSAISRSRNISLIAEIKKASPSKGIIRGDFNHLEIAKIYEASKAQAISVLTEEDYFLGNLTYLKEISELVNIPLLRKDFILEPYQVYESRFYGADAILLISDLLTKDTLSELVDLANSLGLGCLVEVHTEKELKKILTLKNIDIIGINNRDLHTLEVNPQTTERLFPLIPKNKTVVVESGIKTYQEVLFLKILGVSAVLIGQAFMEASDIKEKVAEVMSW